MKASKFVVLAGGILGILAFFLPMVTVTRDGRSASVSALQIVKGVEAVQSAVDRDDVKAQAAAMGAQEAYSETKDTLSSIKGIVLAIFAPALLLAAIGGLGVARRKFGRGAGALSLLLGLVGLGIGVLLKGAAEGDSGIGLTLLLLTGVLGTVGGLMALVKPERAQPAAA